ncbi:aminopeptidase 2 [Cryptococcus neoformans]|uniref:Aminopeptidase 2 n=1 Tax=Cryptococcus neoformans Tu259-1 TaxID=1230072 RepID=A0A854QKR2_CRYNE|nr:aminopeptidase 2 [Cryptococcus neoformans var. grubii 125.91]OXG26630.1 aminopeptidase 2 [Cryptococcus neoformans var. grubii Tu259-1]OXG91415.1 aminopeptidase 2 [Cryptococcus neoformans var. grubii D17-1]OXG98810.1 aminopeptidase 2 [Cryptococcus neoformans var. grubii A2-102-5]OXH15980.1 aminopeptidase 2 [Cryptococcus neoformans var. grubii]
MLSRGLSRNTHIQRSLLSRNVSQLASPLAHRATALSNINKLSNKNPSLQSYRRNLCFCRHDNNMSDIPSVLGGAVAAGAQDDYRLPTSVYPNHYDIVIKTDLLSSPPTFSGEALITLDVNSSTSELVFHLNKELSITNIAISTSDLKTTSSLVIPKEELKLDEEKERATISLDKLPGGGLKEGTKDVKVFFKFESELHASMFGYYRSEGDADENGKKPIYGLTQFEATAARKAFPCWDEPLIKSKFSISMISRNGNTNLSNMPEISSKPWKAPSNASVEQVFSSSYELGSLLGGSSSFAKTEGKTEGKVEGKTEGKTESSTGSDDWHITKFETSPLMSTYLVAYASGEFVSLESEHKSKLTGKTVPLKIFATKDQIKQAQFALDIKKWALPIYEEIFDIPYALPKLDTLVAHDFDAGAMENWGLITGRTTAYLYDPEKSPLSAKKRVAVVQCHELAHMWFGDIVTMKWWDNLWLNEAFATLMGELIILERVWPEWNPRSQFLKTHLQSALDLDAQRSSHPIEVDCPDSNQIAQIFDSISYSKGASVLRMLAGVVGEEKFLKGVSLYLKKHVYNNAETKDLWEGISEASGLDVAKIMANWTLKTGFPVIKVDESADGKITVTQNRFLSTGDVKPEEDETLWYVPLEIATLDNGKVSVDHSAILQDRSSTFTVANPDAFKLNASTIGVFRVAYSPERLTKLGKQASSFTVEDRVGLVSDAATLARAGYAKTSGSLSLIHELGAAETEFLPWSQIGSALSRLSAAWWEQPEDVRKAINKLRVKLFKPLVQKLGFENAKDDAPDVKELRELVVATAAAAEDPEVIQEMKDRFQPFLEKNDDSRIPPDLQRSIFINAVEHGGKAEYEKILEVFNKPSNPSTKVDAMYALCSARDEALLDRTFAMLEKKVKDQDLYIFFFGFGSNKYARRKVANYFKANYDSLIKRYPDGNGLNYLVKGSFAQLSSRKDLEDVKAFFETKDTRKFKLAVAQTCDSIQAAANWIERDSKDVENWLKENRFL